jgi:hypothetical protein
LVGAARSAIMPSSLLLPHGARPVLATVDCRWCTWILPRLPPFVPVVTANIVGVCVSAFPELAAHHHTQPRMRLSRLRAGGPSDLMAWTHSASPLRRLRRNWSWGMATSVRALSKAASPRSATCSGGRTRRSNRSRKHRVGWSRGCEVTASRGDAGEDGAPTAHLPALAAIGRAASERSEAALGERGGSQQPSAAWRRPTRRTLELANDRQSGSIPGVALESLRDHAARRAVNM